MEETESYLPNKSTIAEIYKEMAAYDKSISEHNKTLIESIGKYAPRHYKRLLEYVDVTEKIEITDQPKGTNQNEKYGCFKEVWVEQWSTGMEGDGFAGHIYARFEENEWIKVPYSC